MSFLNHISKIYEIVFAVCKLSNDAKLVRSIPSTAEVILEINFVMVVVTVWGFGVYCNEKLS